MDREEDRHKALSLQPWPRFLYLVGKIHQGSGKHIDVLTLNGLQWRYKFGTGPKFVTRFFAILLERFEDIHVDRSENSTDIAGKLRWLSV